MSKTEAPTMSIQSIGIEQNFAVANGQVFLGALYNKTYLKDENSGFDPQRGFSFQLGYKYPLQRYQELVIVAGQQYQPLKTVNNDLTTQLEDKTIYFRLASEWYF